MSQHVAQLVNTSLEESNFILYAALGLTICVISQQQVLFDVLTISPTLNCVSDLKNLSSESKQLLAK